MYKYEVTLKDIHSKETWVYESLDAFLKSRASRPFIYIAYNGVVKTSLMDEPTFHREIVRVARMAYIRSSLEPASWTRGQFVLLDELGLVIAPETIVERFFQLGCPNRTQWSRFNYDPETDFRNGPVKGIRCRRHWKCQSLRHMATTQEIRENDFLNYDEDAVEYRIKARGRRRKACLPTVWDDYWRRPQKNWKQQRRTQWK